MMKPAIKGRANKPFPTMIPPQRPRQISHADISEPQQNRHFEQCRPRRRGEAVISERESGENAQVFERHAHSERQQEENGHRAEAVDLPSMKHREG
jgi:hypothetical protein